VTQDDFDSYIAAAADALSPLDYEIRSTQDQITKTRVHGVVNSISDPLTQMATTRTTEEMLYLKRLLDGMFETFNTKRREVMAITSMQAMEKKVLRGDPRASEGDSVTAVDKGLTPGEAEKLLQSLIDEKWLERSTQGFYRLSTRALMDLRNWLVETYNDETDDPDEWQRIKFCEACKDVVTVGQRCTEPNCNVRLHNICETAFWNSRPNKKCPKCGTEWNAAHYVGQKAVTSTEDYLRGKRKSGVSKRSRPKDDVQEGSSRRKSRREAEEVEEEVAEPGEEDAKGEEEEEGEEEEVAEAEDDVDVDEDE
jgi:hypothetical protein